MCFEKSHDPATESWIDEHPSPPRDDDNRMRRAGWIVLAALVAVIGAVAVIKAVF